MAIYKIVTCDLDNTLFDSNGAVSDENMLAIDSLAKKNVFFVIIYSNGAAGLGLAVSNASEPLKSLADQVICSNDEHCISYILEHFIG